MMDDNIPNNILRKSDLSWEEILLIDYFRNNPSEQENILETLKSRWNKMKIAAAYRG